MYLRLPSFACSVEVTTLQRKSEDHVRTSLKITLLSSTASGIRALYEQLWSL